MALWAPGPLLKNAVALTFDQYGAAYISQTNRRKSSDLDIREHMEWVIQELSLESLEDTRTFLVKELAPNRSDQNPWMEDFNDDGNRDYHDLSVQTEIIQKVWDNDGDGRADSAKEWARGFDGMLSGVAAGILHYNDEIYLTVAPDLWKLSDTNSDQYADQRESLSYGYGIHIGYAGHDMSGVTLGPDGKIYWSIGDFGVNVTGPDGTLWKYPNQGCVMRCNPDGSEFEVFANGLRNTQELAFDDYGNLFSVDNDGDHPGEHERYVHIIEGSDSGWRINWQYGKYNEKNESYKVWMDEGLYKTYFPGQAAYIIPALKLAYNGPAGIAYNPGSALGNEWKEFFFASYFTGSSASSRIEAFQLQQKGSTFEIVNEQIVAEGIVPTGITFAADGALYINDWKDSYDKKSEGRIWKMDVSGTKNPLRIRTQHLLEEGMTNHDGELLKQLLAYDDQRVRLAAQFELVNRKETEALQMTADQHTNQLARIHAIWGLGQLGRQGAFDTKHLLEYLTDADPEIRAQTCKILGENKESSSSPVLTKLLEDQSDRVKFFAAEALGKIGVNEAFDDLVTILNDYKDSDPHLRHAMTLALSRLGNSDQLTTLAEHPSKFVRIGAVVALRHQREPSLTVFLDDNDPWVLNETARAIHDDFSVSEALPGLAKALNKQGGVLEEPFIRRAINANLRIGDDSSAFRLTQFALDQNRKLSLRLDALWALGYWTQPPILDRVTGRYRPIDGHNPEEARRHFARVLTPLLSDPEVAVSSAAIECAGRLDMIGTRIQIAEKYDDPEQPFIIRQAALSALSRVDADNIVGHIESAMRSPDPALRSLAQEILGTSDINEADKIPILDQILQTGHWKDKQKALRSLSKMNSPNAGQRLRSQWEKFEVSKLEEEIIHDLFVAIDSSSFGALKKVKEVYLSGLDKSDVLARYGHLIAGGDSENGLQIFSRNAAAQCLRCHQVRDYGGIIGPELTTIASSLSREELLLSLVAPNDRIAPGYGTVTVQLKNGEEIVGLLEKEEENEVRVKVGDEFRNVQRNAIQSMETAPSAMFKTTDVLTNGEIRDLMSFLVTLK